MDRFGCITVQICNLNPEVSLHFMLRTLRLGKFADSLCKKPPSSMDELRERAKGYIQMEKMSKFRNERHKSDKRQPLPKGPRYEHYTPLTANHTTIYE
ncbi:hypothetical protein JHK87_024954 [Glycine soja]|nr:hypothetical protein JHK87_024954 [Glycine soja]